VGCSWRRHFRISLCRVPLLSKEKNNQSLRKNERARGCFGAPCAYVRTANFLFEQNEPPLSSHLACTGRLRHTQPAHFTGSFAFPVEQKKPSVRGELLNVGQVPHLYIFMLTCVLDSAILTHFHRVFCSLKRRIRRINRGAILNISGTHKPLLETGQR
jgi:hypothetical protein